MTSSRIRLVAALLLLMILAGAATAGETDTDSGVKLRNWTFGLQWSTGDRNQWDVFGRDELPAAAVTGPGRGIGMHLGRRLGGRFLLGLLFSFREHDQTGLPEKVHDGELLVTGTVLFDERATLQPFVRGGLGGGAVALEQPDSDRRLIAMGTAAIAGGGVLVRFSSRFSLEVEATANVTNFLEVREEEGGGSSVEDWRVKTSHIGWRVATGIAIWF